MMNRVFNNEFFCRDSSHKEEAQKSGSFLQSHFNVFEEELEDILLAKEHVRHTAGVLCTRLMSNKPSCMSEMAFNRAIGKVCSFVELMDFDFNVLSDELEFDDIDEDCIDISFHRRRDMKLNIYFEDTDSRNSVNEAYLSFTSKGKMKVMNDSLPNIVGVIKQLLM